MVCLSGQSDLFGCDINSLISEAVSVQSFIRSSETDVSAVCSEHNYLVMLSGDAARSVAGRLEHVLLKI